MTNFTMFQGDTKRLELTVRDAAGVAVDLSAATSIRWQLARSAKTLLRDVKKAVGSGVTLIDGGVNGRCDIAIASADTENLTPGDYAHETEVIMSDGTVATVDSGVVTIRRALIKPA